MSTSIWPNDSFIGYKFAKKGGLEMLALKDKRADERFVSKAPIAYSFFSTRFWHEYRSMTRNHSKDGMCFESCHALTPGTNLFIRLDKLPDVHSGVNPNGRLRSSTLATVKWCRELPDEHRPTYCVGVRYY